MFCLVLTNSLCCYFKLRQFIVKLNSGQSVVFSNYFCMVKTLFNNNKLVYRCRLASIKNWLHYKLEVKKVLNQL